MSSESSNTPAMSRQNPSINSSVTGLTAAQSECDDPNIGCEFRGTIGIAIVSCIAFFALLLAPHFTYAQPPPVDAIPPHQNTSNPGIPHSDGYCSQSVLSGVEFMQQIKLLIMHRDLMDVPFIEKILGVRLSLSYFGLTSEGNIDTDGLLYQTTRAFGGPIIVTLWVNATRARQLKYESVAEMAIDSESFAHQNDNYLRDCLHIKKSQFYSFFGGDFFGGVLNGSGVGKKDVDGFAKTQSKISLSIIYSPKDNLVSHVVIEQRP